MRENKIDTMKGFLIILVIGIHVVSRLLQQMDLTSNTFPTNGLLSDYIWIILRNVIGFAVPGFLFVSGYLLTKNYIDKPIEAIQFYRKRLIRIYIPFVVWLSVYLVFWGEVSLYKVFMALFFLDGWFHFWFLWIIFICYLLFPLILISIKKYPTLFPISFIIFLIIATFSASLLSETTITESYTINYILKNKVLNLPINIIYFTTGVVFCKSLKNDIFDIKLSPIVMIFIFAVYCFVLYTKINISPNYNMTKISFEIIFNFISILFLIQIINLGIFINESSMILLAGFGVSSYGIYLSHMNFLYISRNFLDRLHLDPSGLYASITFVFCIFICYFLSKVIPKKNIFAKISGF